MSGQKPYRPNAEDFRKYHQGEMSAQEAHDFERATLNDAFEQEAAEGWELHDADDIVRDIAGLQQKLQLPKRRVFPVWQIAASVLLLLTASFLIYWQVERRSDPIAMKESTEAPGERAPASESQPPKNITATDPSDTDPQEEAIESASPDEEPPVADISFSAEEAQPDAGAVPEVSEPIAAATTVEPETGLVLAEVEEAEEETSIEDVVFADQEFAEVGEEGFAAAEEEPLTQDLLVFEDDTNSSDLVFNETLVTEEEDVSGAAPVALAVAPPEPEEAETRKARAAAAPASSTPSPVGGYPTYYEYLKNAAAEAQGEQDLKQGQVTIQAVVKRNGKLDDLEIILGLDEITNEAALKIVREGPRWNPADSNGRLVNSTVQIIVEFL